MATIGTVPMPAGTEHDGFKRTLKALDRQERAERWKRRGLIATAIGGWFSFGGALAWHATHPVVVESVRVLPLGPGNVSLAAHDPATLPPEARNDIAKNAIWTLVEAVEGYSGSTEDRSWEIAGWMLSPELAQQYRQARDPRQDHSRAKRYGNAVDIEVRQSVPMKDLCDATGCPAVIDGYEVNFIRTVRKNGVVVEALPYVTFVRFRRNVAGMPAVFVDKYNIPRAQAWKYDAGRPTGHKTTDYP